MLSISSCIVGFRYLFSFKKNLVSRANFIVPSLILVITIGRIKIYCPGLILLCHLFFLLMTIELINQSLSHLSNFAMCSSFSIFF